MKQLRSNKNQLLQASVSILAFIIRYANRSHVCPLWLYYIFPRYLINAMLNILTYWAGAYIPYRKTQKL